MNLSSILESGISKLDLNLSKKNLENMMLYVELLQKWNKVYNLTAISDPKSIIIRHILDSLAIAPFINGPDILDFGSGAGLPGIPLALAFPEYNFVLLDSISKKTRFLSHVVLSLGMKNVEIVNSRIELFSFDRHFDTIVTRATMSAEEVVEKTSHLATDSGQILIMKGKDPKKELENIKNIFKIHKVNVPYLEEERHLGILSLIREL